MLRSRRIIHSHRPHPPKKNRGEKSGLHGSDRESHADSPPPQHVRRRAGIEPGKARRAGNEAIIAPDARTAGEGRGEAGKAANAFASHRSGSVEGGTGRSAGTQRQFTGAGGVQAASPPPRHHNAPPQVKPPVWVKSYARAIFLEHLLCLVFR